MAEYIERESALSVIRRLNTPAKSPAQKEMLRNASVYIRAIPAADVALVVHGWWVHEEVQSINSSTGTFNLPSAHCSVCESRVSQESPYCPGCGAKMDLAGANHVKEQGYLLRFSAQDLQEN